MPAFIAYIIGALTVAMTVAMASLSNRPVDHFTRDPLSIVEAPAYVGFLSNMCVVAWFGAAAMGWLIAFVTHRDASGTRRSHAMLAAASMLTLLGLDDLFMLHEETLQRHLGVSEKITLAAYAFIVGAIAWCFRQTWQRSPWRWLVPAGLFFTAAIAVDVLTSGFGWRLVLEDSLKFLGIVGVVAWMIATGQSWLMPRGTPSLNAA